MSAIIEIKTLIDVILYHFQVTKRANITFNELWRVCEAAAPRLVPPVPTPDDGKNKQFVASMMTALKELDKMNLIRIERYDGGKDRISKVWLSEFGKSHIAGQIYSHQQRMGNSDAPRRRLYPEKSNSTHDRFPQRRW